MGSWRLPVLAHEFLYIWQEEKECFIWFCKLTDLFPFFPRVIAFNQRSLTDHSQPILSQQFHSEGKMCDYFPYKHIEFAGAEPMKIDINICHPGWGFIKSLWTPADLCHPVSLHSNEIICLNFPILLFEGISQKRAHISSQNLLEKKINKTKPVLYS